MEFLTAFEKVLIDAGVLWNKVIDDYFLTGKAGAVREEYRCCQQDIAEQMVAMAELKENDRIIEPEAGKGVILKLISGYKYHCYCEIKKEFVENELQKISTNFVGFNFLQHEYQYDKIIMNPPFSHFGYRDHILHAWSLLNSGGTLVFLYPKNATYLKIRNQKFIEFLVNVDKKDVGNVCGLCECVIGKIVKP